MRSYLPSKDTRPPLGNELQEAAKYLRDMATDFIKERATANGLTDAIATWLWANGLHEESDMVECAVIKKAVGHEQLTILHRTLDSALSELRELLAQDETIEATLACELLGNAVDQLLALERTMNSNPVQVRCSSCSGVGTVRFDAFVGTRNDRPITTPSGLSASAYARSAPSSRCAASAASTANITGGKCTPSSRLPKER